MHVTYRTILLNFLISFVVIQWDVPFMYHEFNICHKNQPLFLALGDWLEEKKID